MLASGGSLLSSPALGSPSTKFLGVGSPLLHPPGSPAQPVMEGTAQELSAPPLFPQVLPA